MIRRTLPGVGPALTFAAALAIAACGSSGGSGSTTNTGAQKAAQQAQAEYQKCKSQLRSPMSAEDNLNSRLDIGLSFSSYTNDVGNVKVAFDSTPLHQMDFKCLQVGIHLENALNDYAHAANTWNTCIGNINCNTDSIKPQLQAQWSKASSEIDKAKSALQDLQNPNSAATTTTAPAAGTSPSAPPSTSTTLSNGTSTGNQAPPSTAPPSNPAPTGNVTPSGEPVPGRWGTSAATYASGVGTPYPWSSGQGCDQNIFAGTDTSCAFADNIFMVVAAAKHYDNVLPGSITTYGPVTQRTYALTCTEYWGKDNQNDIQCITDTGLGAAFPVRAVSVYYR